MRKPGGKTRSPDPATWSRNRQIVEGALLADISVVLLLGRVYLPIPVVRTVWRLLAGAPFVLLAQRQGLRVTIMAGIVSYLLLTALIGPTLALPALDTAFAALIIAAAMRRRWPRMVIAVAGGLFYAACDIVIPTIAFAVLFRVPASILVGDVKNGIRGAFKIAGEAAGAANGLLTGAFGRHALQLPAVGIQNFGYAMASYLAVHWLLYALLVAAVMGVANILAYHAAADLVLMQLPAASRSRQTAAA